MTWCLRIFFKYCKNSHVYMHSLDYRKQVGRNTVFYRPGARNPSLTFILKQGISFRKGKKQSKLLFTSTKQGMSVCSGQFTSHNKITVYMFGYNISGRFYFEISKILGLFNTCQYLHLKVFSSRGHLIQVMYAYVCIYVCVAVWYVCSCWCIWYVYIIYKVNRD